MNQINVKKLIIKIFKNYGLNNKHALICANALLNAELVGAPSHGLARLVSYCNRIKKKLLIQNLKLKLKKFHLITY